MYWLLVLALLFSWVLGEKFRKWLKIRTYWRNRNVPTFDGAKLKLSMMIPRHEFEFLLYDAIKREGFNRFVGMMEDTLPVLYVTDPELIKHIMVIEKKTRAN